MVTFSEVRETRFKKHVFNTTGVELEYWYSHYSGSITPEIKHATLANLLEYNNQSCATIVASNNREDLGKDLRNRDTNGSYLFTYNSKTFYLYTPEEINNDSLIKVASNNTAKEIREIVGVADLVVRSDFAATFFCGWHKKFTQDDLQNLVCTSEYKNLPLIATNDLNFTLVLEQGENIILDASKALARYSYVLLFSKNSFNNLLYYVGTNNL
jgi:hypothetical protein